MARVILNGGSSSWKCGVYDVAAGARAADASAPLAEVRLSWDSASSDEASVETTAIDGTASRRMARIGHAVAVPAILRTLAEAGVDLDGVEAVGHRVVHGANVFTETTWLDASVLDRLRKLEPFAPSHNPIEIAAVDAVSARLPKVPQYAVFDTQFHRTLAPGAYVYPGPIAWIDRGIRRYGFHGTSVAYATERAAALLDRPLEGTRFVVAHLGGGCSVTAVRGGASVDTSMGFTPLDGTMMGTRSGSIDPGIAIYLMREAARHGTADLAAFAATLDRTLNAESGLAGVSGISGDVREVRAAAADRNPRARLALEVFVHRLSSTIGGLLPSLDRLDALIFTGGIGEHAAEIRSAVCARLAFAGVAVDANVNGSEPQDRDISTTGASTRTIVLTAREEWYIAREGARLST